MVILLTKSRTEYNASVEGFPHLQAFGNSKEEALGQLILLFGNIEIKDLCGGLHQKSVTNYFHNPRLYETNKCHQLIIHTSMSD